MNRGICWIFIGLTLIGCAEPVPPLVPVSGAVRFKGEPVPGASVKFFAVDSETDVVGSGVADATGVYSLRYHGTHDGMPPGKYKAVLSTERPDREGADIFPPEYSNPTLSKLIVTVPEAGGTLNLEVE